VSSTFTHPRPQQAWAHRQGKLQMRPLQPADWTSEALSVRCQVTDAFYRFGMAWDEIQIDALCSCFTEDAVFESSEGSATAFLSLNGHDEMRAELGARMEYQSDQRRHIMSNILVEELDLARGTATALAQCVVTATGDDLVLAASVIYTANLRREDDGCWRFSYFFVGMDRYLERA
jgi:ketosteroid isomerase-like protein